MHGFGDVKKSQDCIKQHRVSEVVEFDVNGLCNMTKPDALKILGTSDVTNSVPWKNIGMITWKKKSETPRECIRPIWRIWQVTILY